MTYHELDAGTVVASVTYHPEEFMEPIRDQLVAWKAETEVIRRPWKEHTVDVEDGEVRIDGWPVHTHVLWRLSSYILGVKKNRWEFWLDNQDLLADSLRRGGVFDPDALVEVRVIENKVVYCTDLGIDLGHHLDYFDPLYQKICKSADSASVPVALLGYGIDPVWTHVNFVYLPNATRTYQVGVRVDTNYLFSRHLRGRAYLGFLGYDLYWESSLNLDTWWSVRTKTMGASAHDMLPNFEGRVARRVKALRAAARGSLQKMTTVHNRPVRKLWRQEMIKRMAHNYQAKPFRTAALRFSESGKTSTLDFAFALSGALKGYPYEKRLSGERSIARHMREVLG